MRSKPSANHLDELFYRYYDVLYRAKDYEGETRRVLALAERQTGRRAAQVLDVGCGTGRHAAALAALGRRVVAIDPDPRMIAIAARRLAYAENVCLRCCGPEALPQGCFDLAIALFNVVTYLADTAMLHRFMAATARALAPGGLFVFDCWNGIAAIADPPGSKRTCVQDGVTRVDCTVTPETDLFRQRVVLAYDITAERDGRVDRGRSTLAQTLWTPMQIRAALDGAGLRLLGCSRVDDFGISAAATDWKILFCVQRPEP